MRLELAASLLALASVQATSDPSPFVLLSTAKFPELSAATPGQQQQLQTSERVIALAKTALSTCPTSRYLLVSQPGVHAADIRDDGKEAAGCSMPNLCRAATHAGVETSYSVAAVLGQVQLEDLADHVRAACVKVGKGDSITVEGVRLSELPREKGRRKEALADNDHEFGRLLERSQAQGDYTIIFFSDPNEPRPYEADFVEPLHMELKRQSQPLLVGKRAGNDTSSLPLFQKYQFFTPGVFMGLIVVLLILAILTAGLKGLASLEISYGAFEKEMGPAAQKKQM